MLRLSTLVPLKQGLFIHYFSAANLNLCCYQARAKLGLLTNEEDTIPGPSDSIGAPKMYIFEKRILGT